MTMLQWLRSSFSIRWLDHQGLRRRFAAAIAAVGDAAGADTERALRQRLPLTAADLDVHARNSGLRRRPGEIERDWRLRLAGAATEIARQGQVRDVRARLDDLMGPGQWRIEEHPLESFRIGDRCDGAKKVVGGPALVIRHAEPARRERVFTAGHSVCDGPDVLGGWALPPTYDLTSLIATIDPDILVVDAGRTQ